MERNLFVLLKLSKVYQIQERVIARRNVGFGLRCMYLLIGLNQFKQNSYLPSHHYQQDDLRSRQQHLQ